MPKRNSLRYQLACPTLPLAASSFLVDKDWLSTDIGALYAELATFGRGTTDNFQHATVIQSALNARGFATLVSDTLIPEASSGIRDASNINQ